MKTFCIPVVCLIAVTGCHRGENPNAATGPETMSLFEKGRGILLPKDLRKEFGVETAEVTEKTVSRRVTKVAQVYRTEMDGKPAAASVLVTAQEVGELKPGQSVELRESAKEGSAITGRLIRVDDQLKAVFGQAEALVEFSDEARKYPAGTVLTAVFEAGDSKKALAVPNTCVLHCADGSFVYTSNGKHLSRTSIKTGATGDGVVEVTDGLYEGDVVAVKGVESLWVIELSALKGGTPCCPVPKKGGDK